MTRLFTLCLFGAIGLSQSGAPFGFISPPDARDPVAGSTTVAGYLLSADARAIVSDSGQVLVHLPSVRHEGELELAGMLQQGGAIELFLGWFTAKGPDAGVHLEVFRGRLGDEAALVHGFVLEGGPYWRVGFSRPADARDNPKVLIDTFAGTTYWFTYLLAADRQSVEKLFASSAYQFTDLDHDGVDELIVWDGRWSDNSWCLDLFGYPLYPRIFVHAGSGYRMAWPPPDAGAANFRVAAYPDLRGDGASELLVLHDHTNGEPTTSALAIYGLEKEGFRLIAQAPLPADRIAFSELSIRNGSGGKEITIRTAPPAEVRTGDAVAACNPRGPNTAETTYILSGGRLQPAQP
jgi:hypothetical protein